MFRGQFTHSVDAKGRISLPVRFREQLAGASDPRIVLTPALPAGTDRVAIYGWHGRDGRPLQPLSTVLGARTVYYNHGVRLVDRDVLLDGEPRDLRDILRDPELALLVSEGPIAESLYR